jgi:hypothetical protein
MIDITNRVPSRKEISEITNSERDKSDIIFAITNISIVQVAIKKYQEHQTFNKPLSAILP